MCGFFWPRKGRNKWGIMFWRPFRADFIFGPFTPGRHASDTLYVDGQPIIAPALEAEQGHAPDAQQDARG